MSLDGTDIAVLAVLFLAVLVRSTFGFGEALVAVPLLAWFIPVEMAVPVVCLHSITVAAIVLAQDRHHVQVRSAARLVLATALGIPLGLWMLANLDERLIKLVLASVIISFSLYCLGVRNPVTLADDRTAWLFGVAAGVLGGAYGMNGPPLVVYASLRRWPPEAFRATLQGYFLPASLLAMIGFWAAGMWTSAVTRYYLLSLPLTLVAVVSGRWLNRRISGPRFVRLIHAGLVLVGIALAIQAV